MCRIPMYLTTFIHNHNYYSTHSIFLYAKQSFFSTMDLNAE